MFSSFFGKTQPIHYVILLGFLFFFYWIVQFSIGEQTFSVVGLLPKLLYSIVLVCTVYFADAMAKKGKFTEQSSFFLLFYVLQMVLFPETLLNFKGIFAQAFLLLGVLRLLDVKDLRNIKNKIFDGTFFICIASLFYSWALVFLLLVFFTINTYGPKSLKTWLSAILGILTFIFLNYTALLLIDDEGYILDNYSFDFDMEKLLTKLLFLIDPKVFIYVLITVIAAVIDFVKFRKKGGGKIILFRFMLLFFVLTILVDLLHSSDNSFIILAFLPAAIFLSNYVQTLKKARLKEIIVVGLIVLPISVALFRLLVS